MFHRIEFSIYQLKQRKGEKENGRKQGKQSGRSKEGAKKFDAGYQR